MHPEPGKCVWVVIAAYNEARVIEQVVAGVRRRGYSVAVVDDASSDATARPPPRSPEKAAPAVVYPPAHLGQGAALQTGIEFALGQGADFIVTFDADGQHRADEILSVLTALTENKADFALGSRFLGASID